MGGMIVYGCGNDLEEQSIELERNMLKLNENISQEFVKSQTEKIEFAQILTESIKSEELEKKENLQNKTNLKIFETLAKELDEDLIKLKQQNEEKNFLKTVMKMNKEIETLIKVEACHQKRKE